MLIGTVREVKTHEYRVGMTPSCVKSYIARGNEVIVEDGAGAPSGFNNDAYEAVGAKIVATREEVFANADMIVKVKEPQPDEIPLFRDGQILYTYLHLAADKELTEKLMATGIKAIAYETIETENGVLPCLKPMSEIAGRLSIQEGAKYLEKPFGGRGILLGGVPGIPRGKIAILGGGVVGTNACKIAVGIGADVTILDINANRLAYLDDIFGSSITTLYSTDHNIERVLRDSDIIIGGVLLPGAKAPRLVRRDHLQLMKQGAVIVDVAVDQGGCVETIKPTTHDDPIYNIDGIVHYGVANMPGAVALSSTLALTSTTLPYGLSIAEQGVEDAVKSNPELALGLNLYKGNVTYPHVAEDLGLDYVSVEQAIA